MNKFRVIMGDEIRICPMIISEFLNKIPDEFNFQVLPWDLKKVHVNGIKIASEELIKEGYLFETNSPKFITSRSVFIYKRQFVNLLLKINHFQDILIFEHNDYGQKVRKLYDIFKQDSVVIGKIL